MRTTRRPYIIMATLALVAGLAFTSLPAFATTIVPDCARARGNAPSLGCVQQTFLNIASLIIAVTGSFALLMFVYGGFMLISSNGESKKVEEGKTIIRNAVIGIALIFLAGYIIDYLTRSLTKGEIERPQCVRDLGPSGYQCMDPAESSGCNSYAIGCGGIQQCCLPRTIEDVKTEQTEQEAAAQAEAERELFKNVDPDAPLPDFNNRSEEEQRRLEQELFGR